MRQPVSPAAHAANNAAFGNYRWTVCALLFFATTVNYLDRQVLSLLAPDLSRQFGWSNTDYANITSIFQFIYAIAMLFAGRVIDRIGTKSSYILAIAIWSCGAVLHVYSIPMGKGMAGIFSAMGFAVPVSVAGFMLARAVLAVGEAGNFPVALKATAEYFPKKERSLAAGIFNSGTNIGAILAPISVPWLAARWGWQAAFMVIGALGFVWLVLWALLYQSPERQKRLSREEFAYIRSDQAVAEAESDAMSNNMPGKGPSAGKASWFKLLRYRQTWAFAFGKFMTDGVWWFYLFWLPKYLSVQHGMESSAMTLPLVVVYSLTMVGSVAGGWFPAYFIKRGDLPYDGRMKAMLAIAFLPLLVLLAEPLGGISVWFPVLLIGIGASAHQAWSANLFTTPSDMFPSHTVASVIGIGGMAGGLGGVVLSEIAGWLFDYYGAQHHLNTGYAIVFSMCALAYLTAWLVMKWLVPRQCDITDL